MSYSRIATLATVLTLVVVVLGAYVRLSDAGLGCPDWPGCYGQIDVPSGEQQIADANAAYPDRPVEAGKAWKEMTHRYVAGSLGLLIVALALVAWQRRDNPEQALWLPVALVALVIFQALLGKWTVTWQLKPLVVTAHLLGGILTLSLLAWLSVRSGRWWQPATPRSYPLLRLASVLGIVLLLAQIALGGWTSSNYAALACVDFPMCNQQWWPKTDFDEAFVLWRGLGTNYEFGVLDHPARVAIHLSHRLGAAVILLYIGALAIAAMTRPDRTIRACGVVVAAVLLVQVTLGIGNIVLTLPLAIAVLHNMTAALLMIAMVILIHLLVPQPSIERL